MAPLAGLLQAAGHAVEGVDSGLYPPMSTLLDELEIPVRIGWDADKIPTGVDRVIIGNAVPRDNPEVAAVLDRGLPFLSQAEAVAHYVLARGQSSLVVAGTHGKTTTSSLLAWILEDTGGDPSYLVGGLPRWNPRGFRLGAGPWMVIEGDEYNTAFFDRGPKFLHYRPHLFVLGPVEYDHADLYPNLDAVLTAFRAGAAQVPSAGAVIVNAWSEHALAAIRDATAPVVAVGPERDHDLQMTAWAPSERGGVCELSWRGERLSLELPLAGEHNAQNAAVALAAALTVGVPRRAALASLASFPGVARRMENRGEAGGVLVVDDFAHHPTALAATLVAARQRWPDRRLVAAFEPRSLSAARREFQHGYVEALSAAAVVLIARPYHADRVEAERLIDRDAMRSALHARGVETLVPGAGDDPVALLLPHIAAGDVVMACSSGSFDGFHRRLLVGLEERSGT
jgi:UDP-N-acetylmuramate: L-alanyl-gamma-D-glutamyl-meso-diaminopimelate ligase